MVSRSELQAQLSALQEQLQNLPHECEGCSAPDITYPCPYCGRTEGQLPDEPPDIRKTNAADDPCPACQLVHNKDPYAPVICRCQKCGNIGVVGISTYDPLLGHGVVCKSCCSGVAPQNMAQPMPWQQ